MKKRVALVLSICLAASVLVTREPANAFKLWPWHKAKVEKVAPAVVTPTVTAPAIVTPVVPISTVKKDVAKDVPVVNKVVTPGKPATPASAAKPCPCPAKKPCPCKKK